MANMLIRTLGNALIVAFGLVLVFIFWTIKVEGKYGAEPNDIILWIELAGGIAILIFGLWRLIKSVLRGKMKWNRQ